MVAAFVNEVFDLQTAGCVSFAQFFALIDGFTHGAKVLVCGMLRRAPENFFDVGFDGDAAGVGELGWLFGTVGADLHEGDFTLRASGFSLRS
jgi:hypothetical protein